MKAESIMRTCICKNGKATKYERVTRDYGLSSNKGEDWCQDWCGRIKSIGQLVQDGNSNLISVKG